jgi:hypothetical protein
MVSIDTFRKIGCSFPETTEEPHFEKSPFNIKKKIFATYDTAKNRASIKLSEIDQNVLPLQLRKLSSLLIMRAENRAGHTLK